MLTLKQFKSLADVKDALEKGTWLTILASPKEVIVAPHPTHHAELGISNWWKGNYARVNLDPVGKVIHWTVDVETHDPTTGKIFPPDTLERKVDEAYNLEWDGILQMMQELELGDISKWSIVMDTSAIVKPYLEGKNILRRMLKFGIKKVNLP